MQGAAIVPEELEVGTDRVDLWFLHLDPCGSCIDFHLFVTHFPDFGIGEGEMGYGCGETGPVFLFDAMFDGGDQGAGQGELLAGLLFKGADGAGAGSEDVVGVEDLETGARFVQTEEANDVYLGAGGDTFPGFDDGEGNTEQIGGVGGGDGHF